MVDARQILAENLARLIAEDPRDLTRREVADRSGVGRRTIGSIEAQEKYVQLSTLCALAAFFEKEPWQLIASNLGGPTASAGEAIGHAPSVAARRAIEAISRLDRDGDQYHELLVSLAKTLEQLERRANVPAR